jgi:hypothetical protein
MKKHSEFWIMPADVANNEVICESEEKTKNFPEYTFIRVIEYSAYEQLKKENKELKKRLK